MASTAIFISALFGLDNGLSPVSAAFRAHMMGQYRLVTLRTSRDVRQLYAVMGPSRVSLRFRFFFLRYGHRLFLLSLGFKFPEGGKPGMSSFPLTATFVVAQIGTADRTEPRARFTAKRLHG
jgi:hypothetical protein